jgi:hypothetical protein
MFFNPIVPSVMSNPKPIGTKWVRLRFWLLTLLTLNFAFLISACGLDVEDPTPPSPPKWVEKTLPEEWPERGIDAHESGGILLEWEPNRVEENIKSYLLYRAEFFAIEDSLGDFELLASITQASIYRTQYIDRNTTIDTRYHYVLIAENDSETQSVYSDTLNYMLLTAIWSESMTPNGLSVGLPPDRKLLWWYRYAVAMESYTITILSAENELVCRRELTPRNYTVGTEYFTLPDELVLTLGNTYKWRVDMGGSFTENRETAGCETQWATFLYSGP